jgi:hypothetical protein
LRARRGVHLEICYEAERRVLQRGEIELANARDEPCLRLETVGRYDPKTASLVRAIE